MRIGKNHFLSFFDKYCEHEKHNKLGHWVKWEHMVKYVLPVKRQPEFFAQCCYESNYFRNTDENLYYTTPDRIVKFFSKVKTIEKAKTLVRKPKALAKYAYYSHKYLGNNTPGAKKQYEKGWIVWDFRGKGYIQLTGFNNYEKFSKDTGINCFKDKDYFIKYPWTGSAWFWVDNDLDYCLNMREMTKIINGGYNGIKKRIQIFKDMLEIMKEDPCIFPT